jgi:hypothetical protein
MDRKEDKAKTVRGVLLGYALMIESAKNTPFYKPDFSAKPEAEEALQKTFGTIDMLKRKLESLVNSLDSANVDLRFAEKTVRGQGVIESDNEKGTSISSIIKNLDRPTPTARQYLALLQRCHLILKNLLEDKVTSLYNADFLVRAVKELLEPASVFSKALNRGKDNTPEEKQEFTNACRVVSNIGAMIKNQPYVKLRSLMCDMFGTGSAREFEGLAHGEPSLYVRDYDLSTKEGLDGFVALVGRVSANKLNQLVLNYSDGMTQALREIFQQIKDNKLEIKGSKEAIEFLNAYSSSDKKTAAETKEAVAKSEEHFKRTTKGITDAKLNGRNFLPVAGIGQVLNPLRYQNGARSKDLIKLQDVMRNAYAAYRGWQDLQDKLLTSARVLCGFARNRVSSFLDKQGGFSWFREDMEKLSFNNIQTDPKCNAVVNGSFEELVKIYFALETESSKMHALPILLLSEHDEIRKKVKARIKTEDKVVKELKGLVQEFAKRDFVGEIALALKDASVPVVNFHKIKSSAKDQESPNKIATTYFLKFCKVLYQNVEKGKSDDNLRILLQEKIKNNPDFNLLALRICEMCGFVPSNIGRLKNSQEYTPKDAQSAYLEVVEELSRENNMEALNNVLSLFENYAPWKVAYEKEVARQVEKRKTYEIERAIGWQEVLKNTCAVLCNDKEDNYKAAVSRSAYIANVLVSSLLADAVLKDAGYRDKVKIDSSMGSIARRLWDRAEDKAVEPSPAEDTALELFLEPLIRREYEIAVSKAENALTKDALETVEIKKGSPISFVNNGAFIDFDEDAVMQSLGEVKEYVALKEGARGNAPLEEYANAKIQAFATDKWLPDEKYAGATVYEASFSAEEQKKLFEELGVKVKEGNHKEAFELLGQVERNNPFFCLVGAEKTYRADDIKEEVLNGNANLESLLKEARWEGVNAQFSERMGGTSEAVKLKMSQRCMDEKKAEIEEAKEKAKRFEHITVENKRELVAELLPSVCKVFCSEVGYLVGKDITDGQQAIELGLQVARSKEVLEKSVAAEHRDEIVQALARYVEQARGDGEYSVSFQAHLPSQVSLDIRGLYNAEDFDRPIVSVFEPDSLYQMQDSRSAPEPDYEAFMKNGKVNVLHANEDTYSKIAQKRLFSKTTKKGTRSINEVKVGLASLSLSERYVKEVEASSPVKTYAQSLAKTIMNS